MFEILDLLASRTSRDSPFWTHEIPGGGLFVMFSSSRFNLDNLCILYKGDNYNQIYTTNQLSASRKHKHNRSLKLSR